MLPNGHWYVPDVGIIDGRTYHDAEMSMAWMANDKPDAMPYAVQSALKIISIA